MMAYSGMATELVEVSQVNTPFTGVWCFVETWVDGYGQNPRSPLSFRLVSGTINQEDESCLFPNFLLMFW
jgi:hypothetical protein